MLAEKCAFAAKTPLSELTDLTNPFKAQFFSFTKLFCFLNFMYVCIVCVCVLVHICGHMCEDQNLIPVFSMMASYCIY